MNDDYLKKLDKIKIWNDKYYLKENICQKLDSNESVTFNLIDLESEEGVVELFEIFDFNYSLIKEICIYHSYLLYKFNFSYSFLLKELWFNQRMLITKFKIYKKKDHLISELVITDSLISMFHFILNNYVDIPKYGIDKFGNLYGSNLDEKGENNNNLNIYYINEHIKSILFNKKNENKLKELTKNALLNFFKSKNKVLLFNGEQKTISDDELLQMDREQIKELLKLKRILNYE